MTLEEQSRIFGYQKLSFKEDWEITLPISARKAYQTAIILARAEGSIRHAEALEARLPELTPEFRYVVGRLRNGCQVVYVTK